MFAGLLSCLNGPGQAGASIPNPVDEALPLVGTGPEPGILAEQMSSAWIAFARSGNPGWRAYDLTDRPTMMFDVMSHVENDPFGAERRVWEEKR